jgi:hypothetical protein
MEPTILCTQCKHSAKVIRSYRLTEATDESLQRWAYTIDCAYCGIRVEVSETRPAGAVPTRYWHFVRTEFPG